jgi:hypothetical protein
MASSAPWREQTAMGDHQNRDHMPHAHDSRSSLEKRSVGTPGVQSVEGRERKGVTEVRQEQ